MQATFPLAYLTPKHHGYNELQALEIDFKRRVVITQLVVPAPPAHSSDSYSQEVSNIMQFWVKVHSSQNKTWKWLHGKDKHTQVLHLAAHARKRQVVSFSPAIITDALQIYPQHWRGIHPNIQVIVMGCSYKK